MVLMGTRNTAGLSVACCVCGSGFVPERLHSGPRYCSKACIWAGTKNREFNASIARASATIRGDAQRGRGDGRTYRKLNGRHEHRVIAEAILGRPLRRGEVVHHIDGNKLNNSPSNLAVMSQGQHMREHGIGIPGAQLPWKPWTFRRDRGK